jgi:hypothetical protein
MIQNFLKKHWLLLLGVTVGAVGGYLYYIFVGCNNGSCPITSSPTMSTLWGAVLGGLLFDMFNKKEKKQDE